MKRATQQALAAFTALLLAPLAASHAAETIADRLNIVFVLTDDQRWDAAGFASGGAVWSPGLDKLRSRGMQFTRAYAAYALCKNDKNDS
jgi:hypothetical protein